MANSLAFGVLGSVGLLSFSYSQFFSILSSEPLLKYFFIVLVQSFFEFVEEITEAAKQ